VEKVYSEFSLELVELCPLDRGSGGSGRILGLDRQAADVTVDPDLLRRGLVRATDPCYTSRRS
jgi:hypothetical protein